ncbi:MAG: asparagine synthase (glutamine-hydrolyzing) [Nitrospira sp.]|nr:MAG: asparagine synthase (glutamine-hydrolyzing) [Nitrospira sp.]
MCGIAGKLYLDPTRVMARQELAAMVGTLTHRGPDGEGIWIDKNIGLAHRRLSIIDLRTVAAQPMSNEDGTVWVTFNGEIYNFNELRKDLESRGHVFRTNSDTEVIVHSYEEYGRDCLTHLRGMFAFAVWNTNTRTLFIARDRVGKKPLVYYCDRERFLFASEIKSLLTDPAVQVEVNSVALDQFLAFGYVPAPLTSFTGIKKLPAAHWLELRDGRIEIGRYWKLHYTPKRKLSLQDAVAELQWRLAEAVKIRLVSDVPLGAFLSGGIDSSAVVAYMAQAMNRPVRTFCVGFEDAKFDERPFARMVAKQFGTDHTELVVKAPVADILPRLIWHYDEPFGDSSAVPSYAISQLTRQYVTVVLNGDGGDESFAGYDRYVVNRRARIGDTMPRWLWGSISASMGALPKGLQGLAPFAKINRVSSALAQSPERRYAKWVGHFSPDQRYALYAEGFRSTLTQSDPEALFDQVFADSDADDWIDATLDADVNLYLTDDLLVKMDRATMAHSLEARSPLLDHLFMEFVASLPAEMKLQGAEKKKLLKAALRGLLPDTILDRPKMGFGAPLQNWFRTDLKDMAHDVLLSPRATQRGYFEPKVVAGLLDDHCSGKEDQSTFLWDLLVLELWHRTFVDGRPGQLSGV